MRPGIPPPLFWRRLFAALLLISCLSSPGAMAAGDDNRWVQQFFPDYDGFGEFKGDPPVAEVFKGTSVIGYVFHTKSIAPIPAYSGKPMDMLVGLDTHGRMTGVRVVEHHEPILLVGIPESRLDSFADQYAGKQVTDRVKVGAGSREGFTNIDAITGATVTVMVMNEAIMRAARKVAVSLDLIKDEPDAQRRPARVRMAFYQPANWEQLTGNGAIRRMHLTRGQVDDAFKGTAGETVGEAEVDQRNDTFIDLYYTYLNPPAIGRNLLGESQYNWLMSELKEGEHAIALMANGIYSFKGSGYVRGGIFDRIAVRQRDREISFRDLDFYRLNDVYAEGMPPMGEMALFIIRDAHHFDPGTPWEIELLIKRQVGPLESVFTSFASTYDVPDIYVERFEPTLTAEQPDDAIWVSVWRERGFQITVLVVGLTILTVIMMFQDFLVRFPRLIVYLRTGFLVYTLFFIGWYLLGQLSVVNVLTFTNSIMKDFSWDTFLIDPTMFILWVFVAASLLLWGRGVYCGWLCPFGALQKLISQAAIRFKVPQLNLPQIIHDRLWGIKYIILLVLFGVSLQSLAQAERYAEIEPFKTAITLRFDREWPFLLYALGLLVASAFNSKFYCKYLCPLGAALAVPGKFRLTNWLRRRKECGNPCQICANECEIQAIYHTGEINLDECHFCMDCQVTYWDDKKCPPLVKKRKKHERTVALSSKSNKAEDNKKSALSSIPIVPGDMNTRSDK